MKMNKMLCLCLLLSFIIITEEHHSHHTQQSKYSFNKRHHTPNHEHKKDVINKSHNQNVLNVNNYPRYTNKTESHHLGFQRHEMKNEHKKRNPKMFNFKFYKRINNVMSFMYSIVSMVLIGIIALVLLSIAIRMYNNWFLNYQRRQFEKYQFICQQYSDQRNVCNNNMVTNNNNNLDINNLNQRVHHIYHSGISVQTKNINVGNH